MTTPPSSGTPEKVFSLIHVDRSLLVANKPTRLLSVPGRGPDKQDCLVSRIQTEFPDALIVHRLDYDTSGLLVLARGKAMHRELSILFQERQIDFAAVGIGLAVHDGDIALGDPLYADENAKAKSDRLMLHAEYLSFTHPTTGKMLAFTCPAPF